MVGCVEVRIGTCRLFLGDAGDVLPHLCGIADLFITDWPYRLTSGGNGSQVMGGVFASDRYDNGGELIQVVPWEALQRPIWSACKVNADAYVMANDKNVFKAHAAFEAAGWQLHNLLDWDKVRATRNRWYMKHKEFTVYLWKGRARVINFPKSMQSFQLNARRVTDHPTEKPVEVMQHYIENSSDLGGVVLDPFMGTGATLVAAAQAGRVGVGIEIEPEWFGVACERVAEAQGIPSARWDVVRAVA